MKAARIMGLALLVAGGISPAWADWRFDAGTGVVYDSNLSNSDRASDMKDDEAWQNDLRAGNAWQLSRDLRLSIGGDLHDEVWARFDAFNHIAPGGDLTLRYRFGLGRLAPWVRLEENLSYAFFHEDDRSGIDDHFRVRGGVGITDWLSAEVTYTFDDFEARDDFWNLSGHSAALRLIFAPTSSLQVALGYSYRNGEVISYALPARPDIFRIAAQAEPVTSFGTPLYMAYRLEGVTNAVSLSASYSLNKYLALEASYEFRDTTHSALEYVNHVVEAKIVFEF